MNDADHKAKLLTVLARHIGSHRGVRTDELAREVFGPGAGAAEQRRIRQLVVELRCAGEHVCADPVAGYFMARSQEELERTCRFLLDRAMTSLTQISAMKRVSLPDLAGQLRMRLEDRE